MLQETPTLLPIATWGKILGVSPVHLMQVSVQSILTSNVQCGEPVMQQAWQSNGRVGREDIATAIRTAEEMLRHELGFSVLPEWFRDEYNLHDRLHSPEYTPWMNYSTSGRGRTITLQNGYLIAGGVRAQSVIQAAAPVVYSDPNGDGYFETATVGPIATSVTDVNQIALYMVAGDTSLAAGAEAGEIRPINVTLAGGNVTITFARELGVLPDLVSVLEPVAVNGTNNAAFITTVDVYRRYTDPQTQATLGWAPGMSCGWCGTDGCATCAYGTATACLLATDERRSIAAFHPATWDGETEEWTYGGWSYGAPDFVRAYYRAGWRDMRQPRPYYDMDTTLARAVTYLAASLLDRPFCGCDSTAEMMQRWQTDLAQTASNDAGSLSWQTTQRMLDNPLGTRAGAVWAWQAIQPLLIGRGLKAG